MIAAAKEQAFSDSPSLVTAQQQVPDQPRSSTSTHLQSGASPVSSTSQPFNSSHLSRGYPLKLRGLPVTTTAKQISSLFGDRHPILGGQQGIVLKHNSDGQYTGDAFVQMETESSQKAALQLHHTKMGYQYIEVDVASWPEMQRAFQQSRRGNIVGGQTWPLERDELRQQPQLQQHALPSVGIANQEDATVKLRGLPFSAGLEDVASWLAGFHVIAGGIKLMTKGGASSSSANTGIAFVQFIHQQEAARAARQLHLKMMGPRYIECIYPLQRHSASSWQQTGATQIPRIASGFNSLGQLHAQHSARHVHQPGGTAVHSEHNTLLRQPSYMAPANSFWPQPPEPHQMQLLSLPQQWPTSQRHVIFSQGPSYLPSASCRDGGREALAHHIATPAAQWQHLQYAHNIPHHHFLPPQQQMAVHGARPGWDQARGAILLRRAPSPFLECASPVPWFPQAAPGPQMPPVVMMGSVAMPQQHLPPPMPAPFYPAGSSTVACPPLISTAHAGNMPGFTHWQHMPMQPGSWNVSKAEPRMAGNSFGVIAEGTRRQSVRHPRREPARRSSYPNSSYRPRPVSSPSSHRQSQHEEASAAGGEDGVQALGLALQGVVINKQQQPPPMS